MPQSNSSQLKGQFQIKSKQEIRFDRLEQNLKKVQLEIAVMNEKNRQILEEIRVNGGKNCGWDGTDHSEFLKIRTKHHN